jgi:hypothetical protein
MNVNPPKLPAAFRPGARRTVSVLDVGDASAQETGSAPALAPAREPEDDVFPGAEPRELGWRSSSYDLKHGLDVVELPTTLPVDVLDRLFNAPAK